MKEIERFISDFISKNKQKPVIVEIGGDLPPEAAERINRIVHRTSEPRPVNSQTVTTPIAAYAELLRAQANLDVLRTAWNKSIIADDVEPVLRSVFGAKRPADHDTTPTEESESKHD